MFADLTVLENLKLGAYLRKDKAETEKELEWVYRLFPVSYPHLVNGDVAGHAVVVYAVQSSADGGAVGAACCLDGFQSHHVAVVAPVSYTHLDVYKRQGDPGEKPYLIRLGGPTCLAGDVVGDYSFASPLTEGPRLIFGDMAIYTTCKNNTFNGMPLPPSGAMDENGTCRELVKFGYSDFKMRLRCV